MYFNRFMETAMNAPDAIFTPPASNFSGDAPDTARFAELLTQSRQPFPASTKSYLSGAIHPGLRVPVRDIALTNGEQVSVYDTSGPYTDPDARIDIRQGLPAGKSWKDIQNWQVRESVLYRKQRKVMRFWHRQKRGS